MYTLATSVVEELQQQNPYYQESAYGLLLSLYIELLRIHSRNEPMANQETEHSLKSEFVISPALEYITKHYMKPVTIDFLADLCHLSTTHFRRKFHEIMGTSPLDFLNSTRIEEACKQLKSTEDSILSISEQVGYRSISSFNRCFSRLIGEPPKNGVKGRNPKHNRRKRLYWSLRDGFNFAKLNPAARPLPEFGSLMVLV